MKNEQNFLQKSVMILLWFSNKIVLMNLRGVR